MSDWIRLSSMSSALIFFLMFVGCSGKGNQSTPDSDQKQEVQTVAEKPARDETNAASQTEAQHETPSATPKKEGKFDSRGEKYAVLIGVTNYQKGSGLRPLSYTNHDIVELSEVLLAAGYRKENLVVMTDQQEQPVAHLLPEKNKILKQIESIARDRGSADSILVAFAGHGVQFKEDKDGYFCPLDAEVDKPETLISLGEIYRQLEDCDAGFKVVLCDACRDDPLAASSRGLSLIESEPQSLLPPPGGVAVFYSCSPGEFAYEDPDLEHGVFFNFVIDGLRGKADLDGDGQVTLPELEYHAKRRVSDFVRAEINGRRQMPNLKGDTRGLVALVELPKSDSPHAGHDLLVKKVDYSSDVMGTQYVLEQILAHQSRLPANSRHDVRYFSCNHLLARGVLRTELELQRDALVKTLNHLTYEPEMVPVETIDEAATLFAVDLRNLGWQKEILNPVDEDDKVQKSLTIYDLVLLEYPYNIRQDESEAFGKLQAEYMEPAGFVRQVPFLRTDWFCSNALQPVLYHDILQLPATVPELEREVVRIDIEEMLERRQLVRGAVNLSKVSSNGRVFERYPTSQGSYWKSIDFTTSNGENIFRDPIHVNGDSGEMIFSLPNGLQGYYLADAAGQRMDAAPSQFFTDEYSRDKVIRNALSCIRCHVQGVEKFKDVVRTTIEKLPDPVEFEKDDVLEIYPPQDDLDAKLKTDADRFMNAMEEALGHSQESDPLIPVTRRFLEDPLTLDTVAGELGMSEFADLADVFADSRFAATGLISMANQGTIRREMWEDSFQQVVRQLKLGDPVVAVDALSLLEYKSPGNKTNVSITTTRGSKFFAPGDEIAILVANNGESTVYIELVGTGTKGEKVVLTENGAEIEPGGEFRFPQQGTITIKPNVGREQITLFASHARFKPGILFRGKNVADRLVHQVDELVAPMIKKTLVIETR